MALRYRLSLQLDRDLVDLAGELVVALLIVVRHRRAPILPHVGPLIGREDEWLSLVDSTFRDSPAVDKDRAVEAMDTVRSLLVRYRPDLRTG